jgi:hypothetical protein
VRFKTLYSRRSNAPKRFFEEYAAKLTGGVHLTAARERLDDILSIFSTNAFDQNVNDRGAKGDTLKQRQLRDKLRTEQM